MNLDELGWNHFFQQQLSPEEPFTPARVYRQDKNQYHLFSEQGKLTGIVPGRLRKEALSKAQLPCVGDWVLVSEIEGAETGTVLIERLLERKSKFSRKEAGDVVDEQIIAANIDTAFIVSGLDDNFNPHRIERYLLLSWNSGAIPVIILNKADLCDDIDKKVSKIQSIAAGTPIHVISATSDEGLEALQEYMTKGSTCVFLGSSGVGKSTIINTLLGFDKFETSSVREEDSMGRHTTTFRELVQTPDKGLIIDTPGMRELQIWADSSAISQSFDDVVTLAYQCKFSDCQHNTEPGCAITKALATGELAQDRLDSYYKLLKEVEHLESQKNTAARAEKKQASKKFARLIRNRSDKRD